MRQKVLPSSSKEMDASRFGARPVEIKNRFEVMSLPQKVSPNIKGSCLGMQPPLPLFDQVIGSESGNRVPRRRAEGTVNVNYAYAKVIDSCTPQIMAGQQGPQTTSLHQKDKWGRDSGDCDQKGANFDNSDGIRTETERKDWGEGTGQVGNERVIQESSSKEKQLESNWDRLQTEEAQGLLISLLKTKMEDLQVIATILDAHHSEGEAELKGIVRDKPAITAAGGRTELSLDDGAPKGNSSSSDSAYPFDLPTVSTGLNLYPIKSQRPSTFSGHQASDCDTFLRTLTSKAVSSDKIPGPRPPKGPTIEHQKELTLWGVKLPSADSTVVRRTLTVLAEHPDGLPGVNESEEEIDKRKKFWATMKPAHFGVKIATKSALGLITFITTGLFIGLLGKSSFGRWLLLKFPSLFSLGWFRKKGPTEEEVKSATFKMWFVGRGYSNSNLASEGNKKTDMEIITRVAGPEIGYVTTPITLLQCALILLANRNKLPKGGVYPPGIVFGATDLQERLQQNGISFDVISKKAYSA